MKKNEIAILIIIVGLVGMATYFLVNSFASGLVAKDAKVDIVDKISTTLAEPDKAVFSKDNVNPTIKIKVGDQSGTQPFNGSQ